MWSAEGPRRRSALVVLAAGLLGGCSVQPLYGTRDVGGGGELAATLQSIAIEPIPDRLGHYVENELSFDLNGTGAPVSPRYKLFITLHENAQTPVIDTVSGRASAATVLINADYRLMEATRETPVTSGHVFVAASYDRTSQRFSNIRAARDAEQRDAKTLADQIYTKIAASFAAKG
jgi:LPS-assembly lipoprotein